MRIFKTRQFSNWAGKEGLDSDSLIEAIAEMERGLNDADLGGHVYKKRIALHGVVEAREAVFERSSPSNRETEPFSCTASPKVSGPTFRLRS